LAHDGIRGIVIATPAERHAALAEAALRAGKDVFVEKPLALKVSEAEALCRLAADERRVLMVGHLIRYHPAFEKLTELCRSGTLGKIQYIYSHRLNLGKIRTEENILWSFAPHDISMILGLLDEIPKTVSATGHAFLHHDVPDVTMTNLTFSGGRAAHVFVSWLHPFKEQRLVVVGDEGMVVFNDTLGAEEKVSLFPHRVHWTNGVPVPSKAERRFVPIDDAEPLNLECRHFLHCMETGETPQTDGEEGVRVLRVLDAAQRSIEAGRIIGV
jgi:UDP-2-acetamido-3-amino-2,3-dideoxy-glucuronate N-acetyltransferase